MNKSLPTLYYVHDPMCSWCWGFRPVWMHLQKALNGMVNIQYVLGGLAADTDQPMSENMQNSIRENWQRIQQDIPETEFNYDFWSLCRPRRSTYPACRAVIASKMQQSLIEKEMILAIQQAYYLDAKNPSNEDVLIQLAANIGL
ncbi:MAG: DsbA family protein, partial [Gammaproteobacteria bacterium]|nr:DsbA family protein [Gammaproteobacteria bacterium]